MDNPTIQPNLNLNDQSHTDDHISQEGVTINANNGSVINSNSGNGRGEITRLFAMTTTILLSLLCDFVLGFLLYNGQAKMKSQLENTIVEMRQETKRLERQSMEGTQWILRQDMFKMMDFHEATKTITEKQYKALRDQFDFYTSIGGNHDARERLNAFTAKILSGEVKVVKGKE